MDDTLPLPNDLAASQRLMARLAAHIRALESDLSPGQVARSSVDSHVANHSPQDPVQVSPPLPDLSLSSSSLVSPSSPVAPRLVQTLQPGHTPQQLTERLPVQRLGSLPPLGERLEDLIAQVRDRDARLNEQAKVILELQDLRLTLQQDVEKLQLLLDKLLKQIYGRRGERFLEDPKQRKLALDFGEDPQAQETFEDAIEDARKVVLEIQARRQAQKPAAKPRSEKFPAHLPRVENIVDVSEEQKTCGSHGPRKLLDYDIVETLKIKRPVLYVEVTKYAKYVCAGHSDCGVVQPQRVQGLMSGNRFDSSIAVEVIHQKFGYHMPFYRQQDFFGSLGWTPARSTLQHVLDAAAELFKPLALHYHQVLLGSQVLGCDETTVTLIVPPVIPGIDPENPRSKRIHEVLSAAKQQQKPSVKARMWAYRGVDIPLNLFDFTVSRHRDGPDEILAKYKGVLLGDCWSGFSKIDLRSELRITRAACWAHARRKVFDGRASHPLQSAALLALIQQLYDIEDRGKSLSAADRLVLRQREALPLLNRIHALINSAESQAVLPKSVFAEALGYLRNHWQALLVYTTNGVVPIDNNDVEQLMKQVATGRNYAEFLIMRSCWLSGVFSGRYRAFNSA